MLKLSDFSLTPNHTLSRLITEWSQQNLAKQQISDDERLKQLLKAAQESSTNMDKSAMLSALRGVLREQEPIRKAFMQETGSAYAYSLLTPDAFHKISSEVVSILVELPLDSTAKKALGDDKTLHCLFDFLLDESLDTRMNAAKILTKLLESRDAGIHSTLTSVVSFGLKRLMTDIEHPAAMAAGLNLLSALPVTGNDISWVVRAGFVPILVELLPHFSSECIEMALKTLEILTATTEGKVALKNCQLSTCVSRLTAVLLKITEKCTLYAVLILLTIFKFEPGEDIEDFFVFSGLPRKLLLVLQSNCNPAVKKRALELLKLLDQTRTSKTGGPMNFKVNIETTETLL